MAPAAAAPSLLRQPRDEPTSDDSESDSLIAPLGRDLSISCLVRCRRADHDKVAALNKSFRSLIRGGELYRQRQIAGIAEPWVYMSCNLMQWEAFDPATRRWFNVPKMPADPVFMHSDKESLAVGTELLIVGREMEDMAIYKYRLDTNQWTTDNPPMNTRRCLFASASAGSLAYVAGGVTIKGEILTSAELYNSDTATWKPLPGGGLKTPRKKCCGVMMDGKFHVMGGYGPDRVPMTSAEVYDPRTMTWEVVPDMCPPSCGPYGCPPLCAVVGDELYAAEVADKKKMELWRYVKGRNAWVSVGKLPATVACTGGWGMAFKGVGERLVVIGGPRGGIGVVEIHSWVPPAAVAEEGDGGGGSAVPLRWEVIAGRQSGTFVYNCAIMSC
ncbi:unnamed protein product [Linum trigynum]|uniref:Uncharacterized protein n=2 Tax=Linum trigynum TaxID=586398 RepID=A0AAV2D6R8_9ROSI